MNSTKKDIHFLFSASYKDEWQLFSLFSGCPNTHLEPGDMHGRQCPETWISIPLATGGFPENIELKICKIGGFSAKDSSIFFHFFQCDNVHIIPIYT